MINTLRAAERLRRQAATRSEPWHAVGREVLDENHNRVAHAKDESTAGYLAALHNNILAICALVFQQCKKAMDRDQMRKEQQGE